MKKKIIRRTALSAAKFPDLSPLLNRIFTARGVQNARELEHGLEHLIPFHTLKNIDRAVECLYTALAQQHRVVIVGDFDADGATSSALAVAALQSFGLQHITFLVPNRFEYGYGLTPEIVQVAAQSHPHWIMTVDNGISSIDGVVAASQLGIRVLITDHHLPGEQLPDAEVILNPNQPDDQFPSKNLAGVGVVFYLMLALRQRLRQVGWFAEHHLTEPNMAEFLDLVALGTVADLVPFDHNNRILVQQGLRRIKAGKARLGIQALLKIANRPAQALVASDLAFGIAPRLNAAGRLDDMTVGINCLLAPDLDTAMQLASSLDNLNKDRKEIEADMQQQAWLALEKIAKFHHLPAGVCLYDPNWHQGVIGILAARVKEKVHRPVVIFANGQGEELKGSGRSIPSLHLRDVLETIAKQNPALIQKFGGHAMAAGLTIKLSHFPAFCLAFAETVGQQLSANDLQGHVLSDGELTAEELTLQTATQLRELVPWGQAFPEPLFDNDFHIVEQRIVGLRHLKLLLNLSGTEAIFPAIAFNVDLKTWPNYRVEKVRAAYRLDINEFQGQKKMQLLVEHLDPVV
ncbi:MAG: single-stranded-DNA-specific exonuclease RecJ [Gammaproteobacteria bacterium]